jgi:hypothetical protein
MRSEAHPADLAWLLVLLLGACDDGKDAPSDAGTMHRDAPTPCRLQVSPPSSPECPSCKPGDDPAYFSRACAVGHICKYTLSDSAIGGLECNCVAASATADAGGTWDCVL